VSEVVAELAALSPLAHHQPHNLKPIEIAQAPDLP
jgi:hypothetical protein